MGASWEHPVLVAMFRAWVVAPWIVLAFAAACGDSASGVAGVEGAPCYGNGTCDDGLTCASDLCVVLPGPNADSGVSGPAMVGSTVDVGTTMLDASTTPPSGKDAGASNDASQGGGGSGGSSGSGGAGGNDAGGSNATDGGATCEAVELEPGQPKPPANVLILFDRSGSMDNSWAGPNPKWIDARDAVTAALTPLQTELAAVGALLFPRGEGAENECAVDPIEMQFPFVTGPNFLQNWNAYWMQPNVEPGGATPLLTAQQQADQALFPAGVPNPLLQGETVVVIITDGQPNCSGGDSQHDELLTNLTPIPIRWLTEGIKTYVLGVPDANLNAAGLTILDGVAMAGGTGSHIPADNPMALQDALSGIVQSSVTTTSACELTLDPPADDPDEVHVIVVEGGDKKDVPRVLGGMDAWTIDADGAAITLQGDFCAQVEADTYQNLSIAVGCVDFPALTP